MCKKCIKGFDHHCNWIDNCVGENNKIRFVIFVSLTLLNLIFNFFVGLGALKNGNKQALNNNNNNYMKNIEEILNMRWIFTYGVSDLIAIMILIVSFFFFIPVSYVLWNQLKNFILRSHR